MFEEVPLLVRRSSAHPQGGYLDRFEDALAMDLELAVILEDVPPRTLVENDSAAVRIDRLGHPGIVTGRGVSDNCRSEPRP